MSILWIFHKNQISFIVLGFEKAALRIEQSDRIMRQGTGQVGYWAELKRVVDAQNAAAEETEGKTNWLSSRNAFVCAGPSTGISANRQGDCSQRPPQSLIIERPTVQRTHPVVQQPQQQTPGNSLVAPPGGSNDNTQFDSFFD